MTQGDDFTKKCQNCKKCKPLTDYADNIIGHACLVDGEPLGYKWPIHITTCKKFVPQTVEVNFPLISQVNIIDNLTITKGMPNQSK